MMIPEMELELMNKCESTCMCAECIKAHRKKGCEFGKIDGYGICQDYCTCYEK